MTASQDVELMEFSLLKTLNEFIPSRELFILRLDHNHQPYYQLKLSQESYVVHVENVLVEESVLQAIHAASCSAAPLNRQLSPAETVSIWHLIQLRAMDIVLVAITPEPLSGLDCHMVSGLLGVYRNFISVLNEAQHDQLTGLLNRRTFDDIINKIYSLQQPLASPTSPERRTSVDRSAYWLVMVDLDHFKRINDIWGHLYGDEVLLLTAQLMQTHFRATDHLFRFGGEEFVIVLRAAQQNHAQMALERFRLAMEEYDFPQVGQVTISLGVTRMDPNQFTATLLDQADQALYFAKEHGRNQVCFYETLVANGEIEKTEIITGDIELF
jgi:diguanylate cyclase (GGDEF)-like protein